MARRSNDEPVALIPLCTFTWAPFLACSEGAQLAWLKMYCSPEMRRTCVGLFPGGVASLAERLVVAYSRASELLDELVEAGLVEHDPHHKITRFLSIPSRADRPPNGNCIIRWWKGFVDLPRCRIRDSHIPFLMNLCHPMTKDHAEAWNTTFATVSVSETDINGWGTVPQTAGITCSRTKQLQLLDINKMGNRSANHTIHDLRSTIYDQGEESEGRELSTAEVAGGSAATALTARANGHSLSPRLLPSPPDPIPALSTATSAMLAALSKSSGGRIAFDLYDDSLSAPLERAVSVCVQKGATLDDFDLAGRFLRAGAQAHRDDLGASWASRPGNLLELVSSARRWNRGEVKIARAASGDDDEAMPEPAPPSAFTTGLRSL
jgi:hypothetical protein